MRAVFRWTATAAAVVLAIACDDGGVEPGPAFADTAYVRVLHTVLDVPAVDVWVGDRLVLEALAAGEVSAFVPAPAGTQTVEFRPAGSSTSGAGTRLGLLEGDSLTVFTIDSSSVLNPWVLTDTGATVPAGKSKLRVVHFAELAPALLAWRTQPDFGTLITIQFPFPYQNVTPYLQSDAGTWTVLLTTELYSGGIPVLGDSLAATGPIPIPAGESRTVVVLDRDGGGVTTTVITP
jgi:hypothetical protein